MFAKSAYPETVSMYQSFDHNRSQKGSKNLERDHHAVLQAILTVGLHGRGFASSPVFAKSFTISPSIVTEATMSHKPGDRSPCCAVGLY